MAPSSPLESIYPRNPRYGSGIYRRRVRLGLEPRRVTGVVNDDYHAMWLRLAHDGTAVRDVEAGMQRWPKTTCPGAIQVLREIIGFPVSVSRQAFYGEGRAGRNCTHLLDLAFWALGQVRRGLVRGGPGETVVDIEIPDRVRGETHMRATVDGRLVHDWIVTDAVIQAPADLAGLGVFSGFARAAEARLSGLALETAWMLQKAAFVARGRAFVVDGVPARSALEEPQRAGACFAFTEPSLSFARSNVGYVQDFTQGLRELLPPPAGREPG
jgi:hypothetical protein